MTSTTLARCVGSWARRTSFRSIMQSMTSAGVTGRPSVTDDRARPSDHCHRRRRIAVGGGTVGDHPGGVLADRIHRAPPRVSIAQYR